MADPSVSAEPGRFQEVAKAAAELQKAVDAHAAYRDVEQQLEEARAMLKESQGEASCLCTPERWGCARLLAADGGSGTVPSLFVPAHLCTRQRAQAGAEP